MTMATKKPAPTDDLLAQLDSLSKPKPGKGPLKVGGSGSGGKVSSSQQPQQSQQSQTPQQSQQSQTQQQSQQQQQQQQQTQSEQDPLLAELDNLGAGGGPQPRQSSRPGTPSLRPNATARVDRSPMRSTTGTPPPTVAGAGVRTSEEKSNNGGGGQRKSVDSQRSNNHQAFTPATTTTEESVEPEAVSSVPLKSGAAGSGSGSGSGGGSSWWGGFISTATAAVTQAQAAITEMQKNNNSGQDDEEQQQQQQQTQKNWTDQLRGNVDVLRNFSGDLRSIAMPTFQNILQTLAPPISAHERLSIHITHDLKYYPALDPTVRQVFSRVMSQVEGGDLLVVQRGAESGPKRASRDGGRPAASWHDGPWWRSGEKRDLAAVKGLVEGTKLVRASAEGYAADYFAAKGGIEQAAKRATEVLSETNPTRSSEIFLAIQAISQEVRKDLFRSNTEEDTTTTDPAQQDKQESDEEILFAVYLHDPIHGIAFHAISQAIPKKWIDWLDAPAASSEIGALPDSIQEIIEHGGVDPREWVSEWVEESLSLAIGVLAQRYVARRMGISEDGAGRGGQADKMKADKSTESMVESGGGEIARAMGGL